MNKAELLKALAEQAGQHKDDVSKTLDTLLDIIGATLAKGDKLLLVGFGTFDIRKRAERPGRNPQTGEPIVIAEAVLPQFSPGKFLKDRVAEAHKPKKRPVAKPQGKGGGAGGGKGTAGKPKGGKGSKL
jgi:DNA-binding protein HU-beta